MARATQPVSVDGTMFDALLEQTEEYTAEIPEYPVETGFKVSDTIIINPQALNMTLFLSNNPITWKSELGMTPTRVSDVEDKLLESFNKKELIEVITTDKTYKNMGIESISFQKPSGSGYVRQIEISLKEVRTTSTQKTDIPASLGKSGKTGSKGSNSISQVDQSGLYSFKHGLIPG